MSISQTLNYPFPSHPEKRQGNNAIITFEETKVFEIENHPFYQSLSYTKQEIGVGFLIPTSTKKKQQLRNTSCSSSFSIYLSFGSTCTDSNCAKSLQKVKHNIANTCNYPFCDALWKLYSCVSFSSIVRYVLVYLLKSTTLSCAD